MTYNYNYKPSSSFNNKTIISYPLNKSPIQPSSDYLTTATTTTTTTTTQFPTSPQLLLGEQIIHFAHPQHPLSLIHLPDLFCCAGCKDFGSGNRFSCQQCDFHLHRPCALAPPLLKFHPFHIPHQLLFFSKPVKGGFLQSKCDVCGKSTKGYIFRCNACSYQMHPCCAMLSNEINISVHPHILKILPAAAAPTNIIGEASSSSSSSSIVCAECNRKRSGRIYRCTVCDYQLHAVCAKNMVNGIQAKGVEGPHPEKPSNKLGKAGRLVSIVVGHLFGSIIEGLGESVGQALFQSVINKGRHVHRQLPDDNDNNNLGGY